MPVVTSAPIQVSRCESFRLSQLRVLRWFGFVGKECESDGVRVETDVAKRVRYLVSCGGHYAALKIKFLSLAMWRSVVTAILVVFLSNYLSKLLWLMITPTATSVGLLHRHAAVFSAAANESILNDDGRNTYSPALVSQLQLKKIQARQLFGSANSDVIPSIVTVPDVEDKAIESTLNLRLSGVIDSGQQINSRAIITSGNAQKIYAPGDILSINGKIESEGKERDVRLVKILPGRVILDNRGVYESLWLYQDENADTYSTASVTASRPRRKAVADVAMPNQQATTLDRVIKFSMARKAGEVIGYKIKPGHNRQLFEQLGLQANDIVVSVNGMDLNSSAKAMEVYRDLRGDTSASLEILRAGKPLNLYVDIRQLEG